MTTETLDQTAVEELELFDIDFEADEVEFDTIELAPCMTRRC